MELTFCYCSVTWSIDTMVNVTSEQEEKDIIKKWQDHDPIVKLTDLNDSDLLQGMKAFYNEDETENILNECMLETIERKKRTNAYIYNENVNLESHNYSSEKQTELE